VVNNTGTIDQSWSSSSVDGGGGAAGEDNESDNYTAGFVLNNSGTITRSYVTGAVEAGEYIYMGALLRATTLARRSVIPMQRRICLARIAMSKGLSTGMAAQTAPMIIGISMPTGTVARVVPRVAHRFPASPMRC
jgi:hypothetical protein